MIIVILYDRLEYDVKIIGLFVGRRRIRGPAESAAGYDYAVCRVRGGHCLRLSDLYVAV